jgi:hypothetical protein
MAREDTRPLFARILSPLCPDSAGIEASAPKKITLPNVGCIAIERGNPNNEAPNRAHWVLSAFHRPHREASCGNSDAFV